MVLAGHLQAGWFSLFPTQPIQLSLLFLHKQYYYEYKSKKQFISYCVAIKLYTLKSSIEPLNLGSPSQLLSPE